ncbi:MAG TPA: hypothetical protein VG756_25655 [Pseudonocardiaceae bacterium]|jgi:hypothetical protein|nr:hypothetical protein [Pseudonocardiaceae bacterium]
MKPLEVNKAGDPGSPVSRNIIGVDIEKSTERNNSGRASLRQAMYRMLERSLVWNGITEKNREKFVDRGDGALALIHLVDDLPKTVLLNKVMPRLCGELAGYAADNPDQSIRLRAVLHTGDVHQDGQGWFGEAIDVACRLLDAPEVKDRFRQISDPLLVVVSGEIYRSTVRQGYLGIDEQSFSQVTQVTVSGQSYEGWVWVPRYDDQPEREGREHRPRLPRSAHELVSLPQRTVGSGGLTRARKHIIAQFGSAPTRP